MFRHVLLCLLLFSLPAYAYDYPYADPYYASITSAILKADHLDPNLKYKDISVTLRKERDAVPFYGPNGQNKLKIRFWSAGKEEAPLIVMVGGLGAKSSATYLNYLANQFVNRGFHALALPSPFHFSFALSASKSGYPGVTRSDAEDLYELIQESLKKAGFWGGAKIGRIGLIGVSMGALESAYLSEIDAREKKINFAKILLINPPVTPLTSAVTLDALAAKEKEIPGDEMKKLQENVYLFGSQALLMLDIKSPNYFDRIEERLPTNLTERQYLVGASFREFLPALIFTTQQIDDLGILKAPPATDNADARLEEAEAFSFHEYLNQFAVPGLSKKAGKPLTVEELLPNVDIRGVADHLRADERVFLMHNEDDFILSPGQLDYLRGIFGARATTYPLGSHVGNVWFPENRKAILRLFRDLKN